MALLKTSLRYLLAAVAAGYAAGVPAAQKGERLPIGEFHALRIKAPLIDGKVEPGEWERAFTTSGMMSPFGHRLQHAETTVSLGFDAGHFYFLFRCRRGDYEWKLWKSVRENDGYNFGDPSIEIWVTPPAVVPETYQSIINTYPAVMDQQIIPSRGYTSLGWTGRWKIGVSESATYYIIEASVPIKDFGFPAVKNGDVWRFLACRSVRFGAPRAQASWSITQGFSEIPQHPKVHLMEHEPAFQLLGVTSVFSGHYRFPMALAAPEKEGARVTVELRWHQHIKFSAEDRIEKKILTLAPGERQAFEFKGIVPEDRTYTTGRKSQPWKRGYFSIRASTKAGRVIYRQSFPYELDGWTPKEKPAKHRKAPAAEALRLSAQYGPENNVVLVRSDIIDLPDRAQAAGGTIRVLDAEKPGKVLLTHALSPFRNWYSSTHFTLKGLRVPKKDFVRQAYWAKQRASLEKRNRKLIRKGKNPLPLPPRPDAHPKKVRVEVRVQGAGGKLLKTASTELNLIRYRFPWEKNRIGLTQKVIPPWSPVDYRDGEVAVWNRKMRFNGLGLLEKNRNGGIEQIRSMRLVALQDGQPVPLTASEPKLARLVEAQADFSGTGRGAGLALKAHTRVEFDGFVLNTLTIAPEDEKGGAHVEGLYLEVVLPEEEATHFCTTAGGWASIHDKTPKYWSSQQTASGLLIGDFVPYIWLTNSERAFLWFADNDKGWLTDDDKSKPTQEIVREQGTVTLRVHFIELPVKLTQPTTLRWGYQTFPSRPLPKGWRSIITGQGRGHLLGARKTYFWYGQNADWAVLWPYYCSPFPWHLEKSRQGFSRIPKRSFHHPMVGSIAHAIARYQDYERRKFDEYAVDWGSDPGARGNGNVAAGKGPNDFRLYHYQRWVREGDFRGLYVDENYLGLDRNFLTGGAYIRPDGRLQPGYSYLGLREYFKRMKVMFHENRVPAPNLWQHISSGAAYHAWLGDVFFEGENVEPTNLEYDYLEVLPTARMRAIGSSQCAGGVMTMMCQSRRHPTPWEPKHTHQFVGWVMAHDILPEQVNFYRVLAQEARLYEDDVTFTGYWKKERPVRTRTEGGLVSMHKQDTRALLWIVNTSRRERSVKGEIDFAKLGFDPKRTVALNAETGERIALERGAFSVPVLPRDFSAVLLVERQRLKGRETFYASFDNGRRADEALGCSFFSRPSDYSSLSEPAPLPLVRGVKGKGLGLSGEVRIWPRLHVTDAEGRIRFHARINEKGSGSIFRAERRAGESGLSIALARGRLVFQRAPSKRGAKDGQAVQAARPAPGWHVFDLSWTNGKAELKLDGNAIGNLPFGGCGIGGNTGRKIVSFGFFVFGGRRGKAVSAIDEVRCYRPLSRE